MTKKPRTPIPPQKSAAPQPPHEVAGIIAGLAVERTKNEGASDVIVMVCVQGAYRWAYHGNRVQLRGLLEMCAEEIRSQLLPQKAPETPSQPA